MTDRCTDCGQGPEVGVGFVACDDGRVRCSKHADGKPYHDGQIYRYEQKQATGAHQLADRLAHANDLLDSTPRFRKAMANPEPEQVAALLKQADELLGD